MGLWIAEGSKRTNDQVWEEMRRLQRLGVEAEGARGKAAESLKQAQINPFEGLPDKVGWFFWGGGQRGGVRLTSSRCVVLFV